MTNYIYLMKCMYVWSSKYIESESAHQSQSTRVSMIIRFKKNQEKAIREPTKVPRPTITVLMSLEELYF